MFIYIFLAFLRDLKYDKTVAATSLLDMISLQHESYDFFVAIFCKDL